MIVDISDDHKKIWYNEMLRRIKADESEVYDIDECLDCDFMSLAHYKAMLRFLSKQNDIHKYRNTQKKSSK